MPILTARCRRNGLVVPVIVTVSALRELALKKDGKPIPDPLKLDGLIDTGASHTAVDSRVIEKLELSPTGSIDVWTVSKENSLRTFDQFDVIFDLVIPPQDLPVMSRTIPVIAVPLEALGIQALVGRDVLRKGMLIYNGQVGSFSLAF